MPRRAAAARSLCGLLLLAAVFLGTAAYGQTEADPMRGPDVSRCKAPTVAASVSIPAQVFDAYLRFFQKVISPVDGARSSMYPTGSDYARQAFARHGAFLGFLLTAERLLHEGNEGLVAPRIRKHGRWRIHDPLEANDTWLRRTAADGETTGSRQK